MNKQEFIDRTGLKNITDHAYDYVERVYMAAGDMDKDEFCAEFKKNEGVRDSKIVQYLTDQVDTMRIGTNNLMKQYDKAVEDILMLRNSMADFLIIQAEKWSAEDLRKKAIELVGEKEYLRRKIEMGFELWKSDREAIVKYISE